jgi:hypothetical protein
LSSCRRNFWQRLFKNGQISKGLPAFTDFISTDRYSTLVSP